MKNLWILLLFPCTLGCRPDRPSPGAPSPSPSASKPDFDRDVAPFLARHCQSCHEGAKAKGDFDISPLLERASTRREGERWDHLLDVVRSGAMPPQGRPRPSGSETEAVADWVENEVIGIEKDEPGRVVLRRLNRAEYNNTIRDLIGLDLRPADDFPADDVGHGFDNNGEVLAIPPVLMERYLAAADRVVEAAFRSEAARRRIMEPSADEVSFRDRGYRPPVREQPRKRIGVSRVEFRPPTPDQLREQRLFDIFRGFADRAFRRPASAEEIARLIALAEGARADGEEFDGCVKLGLRAVLASPNFLYLVESDPSPTIHAITDFELAARLSYFLWSSLPDDELSRLAVRNRLRHGDTLANQVRRMLEDPRAAALAENFGGQWLQTRRLSEIEPDPDLFPEAGVPLRAAMAKEVSLFLGAIVREDHPVTSLINADFTFVDARLARHYGIDGIVGDEFRRVSLAGLPRGGIVTMAGVLAVTSNPNRTSPVKRGKWILENILGAPMPPAPQGLGDLKDSGHAAVDSLRKRLERHRSDPSCASCHARMDPLGFGLENFDAVGAWRSTENGQAIDASGEMPDLGPFRGPDELKQLLLRRGDEFRGCLTEKMFTYALGRGLTRGDRRAVAEISRRLKAGEDRFSSLIIAIVESAPFQNRDGRDSDHE